MADTNEKRKLLVTFDLTPEQQKELEGKLRYMKIEGNKLHVFTKEVGLTDAEKAAREQMRIKQREQLVAKYAKMAKELGVEAPAADANLAEYDRNVLAPKRKEIREAQVAKDRAERAKEQLRKNEEKQKALRAKEEELKKLANLA